MQVSYATDCSFVYRSKPQQSEKKTYTAAFTSRDPLISVILQVHNDSSKWSMCSTAYRITAIPASIRQVVCDNHANDSNSYM